MKKASMKTKLNNKVKEVKRNSKKASTARSKKSMPGLENLRSNGRISSNKYVSNLEKPNGAKKVSRAPFGKQ